MKYYAVKVGRNPGIYTSWDSCLKEVKGFSNAKYKSFKTRKEAEAYLEEKEVKLTNKYPLAYVDGSFNLKEKIYGAGIVYIDEGGEKQMYKTYEDKYYIHRNVAGEVKASELAIRYAISQNKQTITIYHDYQGIASWAMGEWRAKNDLTKSYQDFIKKASQKIKIDFVKVKGHSNDKYNDLADALAKKAARIS
ncbi:MAG: ribonuclease H family protein [Anaerococcus sp.]|nr:ribonuclease H family protein [Anaerococcus sp.]